MDASEKVFELQTNLDLDLKCYHCWDQCTKYWSMETNVNNWYESSHAIDSTKIFSFQASNTLSGSAQGLNIRVWLAP